eukprot:GHRQ01012343.1.p1 GENE.GHRQ01012343.1~~GHRQ01012343.1.p1  ORF type:complete len:304 (+),score=74.89 GHRQ01012343.1:283-1194(+)
MCVRMGLMQALFMLGLALQLGTSGNSSNRPHHGQTGNTTAPLKTFHCVCSSLGTSTVKCCAIPATMPLRSKHTGASACTLSAVTSPPHAGFAITGHVKPADVLTKSGLQPGQALILTKALGTGCIMAAAMRGQAKGRWISSCLEAMAVSSAGAARILRQHGCSAATDVTGFGLLGHAVEMGRASQVKLELSLPAVPALPGAAECISAGMLSSLHPTNTKAAAAVVDNHQQLQGQALHPLLFDPQTAGGLLAGVDAGAADACVEALRQAGYADACVVGTVLERLQSKGDAGEEPHVPLVTILLG